MALTRETIQAAFQSAGELMGAKRHAEAAPLWREIAACAPESAETRVNLGGCLLELGRTEEAVAAMRAALDLEPAAAWSHHHLGRVLAVAGRLEEAAPFLEAALALDPGRDKARLDLGYVRLAQGDYARGWPLYETRKRIPSQNAQPLERPGEWAGEPLRGRSILLWPEQGFGDQIQFARFAPLLAAEGAAVTLAAPEPLAALFGTLGVEVVPLGEPPQRDAWSLLGSVPGRLGVGLETLPARPYLQAPDDRRAKWAGHAPAGAVGVAWRGRATHPNDRNRSLASPETLAPLQAAGATLIDLTEPVGDFADLAAIVEQLDLVVTVDTALAHLAGALGKPCFVLLPWLRTDWRWLRDRGDSPWYPSLRLFRQPRHGDWTTPIAAAAAAYADFRR
jgi:tetratricopeptide (TPR) repeat protein